MSCCTSCSPTAASALHSLLKTAAVELPDVAWAFRCADPYSAGTTATALGCGHPSAPDVMGHRGEGGAWLSPLLCEEQTHADSGALSTGAAVPVLFSTQKFSWFVLDE